MVNAASTEPPFESGDEQQSLERLLPGPRPPVPGRSADEQHLRLRRHRRRVPLREHDAESLGRRCPAIEELARKRGVPHAGQDLKTGETLLKSVLAPMFARRNLRVLSWVGPQHPRQPRRAWCSTTRRTRRAR